MFSGNFGGWLGVCNYLTSALGYVFLTEYFQDVVTECLMGGLGVVHVCNNYGDARR